MNIINKLNEYIENQTKCVLATVVKKEGHCPFDVGSKLIIDENQLRTGTIGGGDIERFITDECLNVLKSGENKVVKYNLVDDKVKIEGSVETGMICGGKAEVYFEAYLPNPNLYIFGGGGNVGIEIAEKAKGLGFNLVIVDPYKPKLNQSFKYIAGYEQAFKKGIKENSYHLIVTGAHRDDYDILKSLYISGISHKYVGMLAAKKKKADLLAKLKEETGIEPEDLYSPVGFKIGGKQPAEIAISILAQVQAVKYGKISNFIK